MLHTPPSFAAYLTACGALIPLTDMLKALAQATASEQVCAARVRVLVLLSRCPPR